MKKYVAICATLLAALAWAGVALAVPPQPQGKLTGSAVLSGVTPLVITSPVIDGGTDSIYIGAENDQSGNCDGDSGTVQFGVQMQSFAVVCAHYVSSSACCNAGSPKMRFAFQLVSNFYEVVRITDNGASTDTVALGTATSLAQAQAWVNKGAKGADNSGGWSFTPVTSGDFTITASQT